MTDSDQLRRLLQRYARAADARDVEALRALFRPDAIIQGARGEQSLEQWLQAMGEPRAYPVSMHVIGEPLIHIEGDAADLDTYAVVYQISDRTEGHRDLTLGIRYLDAAVRDQDGWRIRARRAETLWTR
jgi:ketosteroid isomerase-like protein